DKDDVLQSSSAKPDMDILLLNGVGTEGALRILNMSEEKIKERFIPSFFQGLSKCREELIVIEPIQMAIEAGAIAIHQLGEGGILASLWELGEAAGVGLELDLKKMIIRQDVIEICEFSGVNPYQLSATGSVLIVAEDGDLLKEKLEEKGYLCEVIGKTTGRNERVIFNGEEKRYLDRPTQGELQKLYENKGELHA
ncbi:MAG: AIR synthase-related protein, partial [Eubacteriales bacterium]